MVNLDQSYQESTAATPIFFILSPGVDPSKDVEKLGRKLGFTLENHTLHSVSLGQGQEIVAEEAMDLASESGHWVMLQVRYSYSLLLLLLLLLRGCHCDLLRL